MSSPSIAFIGIGAFVGIIAFVSISATNNLSITFVAIAVAAAAVERPRYYTRREAVEYLRSRGFPITASTMTKKCALGLGPRAAARWSQRHLYLAEDLDAWAESFIQPLPANSPAAATPVEPIATTKRKAITAPTTERLQGTEHPAATADTVA